LQRKLNKQTKSLEVYAHIKPERTVLARTDNF